MSTESYSPAEISSYYRTRVRNLRQNGPEWRGACPVHKGTRDSFAVNPADGQAFCHSKCNRGWDVVGLEEELSRVGFAQAKQNVSDIIGRPQERRDLASRIVETYEYRDAKSRLLFEVVRLKDPKDFRQRKPDGSGAWVWNVKGIRPVLYRLPELLNRAQDLVFVVEGEKDVAAIETFGFLATTNAGGAGKWKPEFSRVLRGRVAVVIPDNDLPGRKHAVDVVGSLLAEGAAEVRIVEVPGFKDVAAWIAGGGDSEALHCLVERAELMTPAALDRWRSDRTKVEDSVGQEVKSKFRIESDGVYFHSPGSDRKPFRICGRLEISAMTHDVEGSGWGRLLSWVDIEGIPHEWAMPMSLLAGEGSEVKGRLLDGGLYIAAGRNVGALLSEYLQTAATNVRALSVSRVGWHGDSFVLPDTTIGPGDAERVLLQTANESDHYCRTGGTLAEWRAHVGRYCVGNSRLLLAVSCAFAGPLVSMVGAESGGFHLVGGTSTGKSTALVVAGSVEGGGGKNGFVQTWNATANGLEAVAALHNDLMLPLDEIAQVLPEEAAEIAYLLANGTGKSRMTKGITSRKKLTWTLLFMSAGELTLADHARSAGKQTRGGIEVRLLNIEADAGANMGMFENLHGVATPDLFARQLKEAAKTYFGSPLRALLKSIVTDRGAVESAVRKDRDSFIQRWVPDGACGEVSRACARFALIGSAGELATRAGVTGWPGGEALAAAGRCFEAWLKGRGTAGASDVEFAVRDVRRFIEKHGAARFQTIRHRVPEAGEDTTGSFGPDESQVVKDRAGFRRKALNGDTEYLILKEVFRAEVCRGHDYRQVARVLIERGHLDAQQGLMKKARLPEIGEAWIYLIRASILGEQQQEHI